MDWSDGDYELTAKTLEPAAARAVDAAGIRAGMRVVDLGCGTGNAALEAARRGAEVFAVDPAARLLDVCRARAAAEGLTVTAKQGDAGAIPAEDHRFDALLSVFAVIFAPDAHAAAAEMLRVVRPGGRIVITSWTPHGAIAAASGVLRNAMALVDPTSTARTAPAWGDPAFVRDLFASAAHVTLEEASIAFEAESPAAWFAEQEQHHPAWRGLRAALSAMPAEWERVREGSVEKLAAANEDLARFRATSPYLLITVTPR